MKFGGTSVGSVPSIQSLKRIVEREAKKSSEPVIVVVSALGGVTDSLLEISKLALNRDQRYNTLFDQLVDRHHQMMDTVITHPEKREAVFKQVDQLLEQLRSILFGVYLIHDLSPKTQDAIVAYGERLSSFIVAALIKGAEWKDSRSFIRTEVKHGRRMLATEETNRLIGEVFNEHLATVRGERPDKKAAKILVCGGFISRDLHTGRTTNLGRGGSDYTAAILAAALDAEELQIWTDVDGFMTADPRVIPNAYTINELSYVEATELCNFGAKVVYPPTIYPVCVKNIPIRVLNTFNPSGEGSVIREKALIDDHRAIKGISSINDTALITVTGLSMVGVIGVNRRIFSCLAEQGVSVFMVSQASSENSTSIGVREVDADKAVDVLNEEFQKEIEMGAMYPMKLERDLATIAIVGENMKHTPGIAGKLFGTLGRSGISVVACAQGASETNISFVVERSLLRKSLNVIHDSFFLSEYNVLNLFICGVGNVGGKLLEQLRRQQQHLKDTRRLCLNVVGIANSRRAIFNRDGIDLSTYKEQLADAEATNVESLLKKILDINIFNSVFVDCTSSAEVADIYQTLLDHNVSIVAANKIAASSAYDNYQRLKNTALAKGVKFRFETNVGAGLPIISTINDLVNSGDKIIKIEAVVSGTLNFIFNELNKEVPFSETVRRARDAGYAETDPRLDLSGADVIRKLVILTREAGYKVEQDDVANDMLMPKEYFEGSLDDFWRRLPELDPIIEERRKALAKEGKCWRYVATFEDGKCSAGLKAIPYDHPFSTLEGSNNIVLLTTERYHKYPMRIQGYGAGAGVTAAGVFANIMSIANV